MRHVQRLLLTLLIGSLLATASLAAPAKVVMYIGPTGQSLYARFETSDGVYLAFALVEGSGGGKGRYYAYDSDIQDLGLTTAGTYVGTVHSGSSPSTTAEDAILGEYELAWNGGSEVTNALADGDFENVPPLRTWKLIANSSSELVGDKTLVLDNDTGEKTFAIDFAGDLAVNGKIRTVDSVAIATGTGGGITFGTSGRERNLAKIRITGVTAGTYTIACKVTDGEGNPHMGTVTLKVVE